MVARRPHRLTTLLGKQVGVGVSPLLMRLNYLKSTGFSQSLGPMSQKTASVGRSRGNDLGMGCKNDYDVRLVNSRTA